MAQNVVSFDSFRALVENQRLSGTKKVTFWFHEGLLDLEADSYLLALMAAISTHYTTVTFDSTCREFTGGVLVLVNSQYDNRYTKEWLALLKAQRVVPDSIVVIALASEVSPQEIALQYPASTITHVKNSSFDWDRWIKFQRTQLRNCFPGIMNALGIVEAGDGTGHEWLSRVSTLGSIESIVARLVKAVNTGTMAALALDVDWALNVSDRKVEGHACSISYAEQFGTDSAVSMAAYRHLRFGKHTGVLLVYCTNAADQLLLIAGSRYDGSSGPACYPGVTSGRPWVTIPFDHFVPESLRTTQDRTLRLLMTARVLADKFGD